MKEAQMHLINKMFNDKTIRAVWNKDEEKYYISVIDIAEALTDSVDPAGYWRKLKQRLKKFTALVGKPMTYMKRTFILKPISMLHSFPVLVL